jgi:hypothetical protein
VSEIQESANAMRIFKLSTKVAGALIVLGITNAACVADRPARNGVFNENQYVRKDFLIQGVDENGVAAGTDPGWLMRTSITETSTPNLLGGPGILVFAGSQQDVNLVRFRVTQDKLQLLSMLQFTNPIDTAGNNGTQIPNSVGVTENVVNAWPATNVDLKYRVNLDGETTNFYEENQELDWQVRQWVKLEFDKNDLSDFAPLGVLTTDLINKCADIVDSSATLVDGSFIVEGTGDDDVSNDYMEFTVQVTVPMMLDDATCNTAYGAELLDAARVNGVGINGQPRNTVTVNLKYSFARATPLAQKTYKPWIIGEKDPIRTKYMPFLQTTYDFDQLSNLVAANQYISRFDPAKPIVWYFDENFPDNYKNYFRNLKNPADPTTVQGATNALLNEAHKVTPTTTAQVSFLDYNDGGVTRQFGDIRYNFLRWESDEDVQKVFVAVTMPGVDPRDGEIVNEGILYNYATVLDTVQRVDAFLVTVGASQGLANAWSPAPPQQSASCSVGATYPIVPADVLSLHNAGSTLFTKMQQYLNLNGADPNNNHLGPSDFAATANETDGDFLNAYLALAPYEIFQDPATNVFVTPEAQGGVFGPTQIWQDLQNETAFQSAVSVIDSGQTPFSMEDGVGGVANAATFINGMRTATQNHGQVAYDIARAHASMRMDAPGSFSIETAMERDSRMCVCGNASAAELAASTTGFGTCPLNSGGGTWETKDEWTQRVVNRMWAQVLWHEFGHSMGLEHNFMGSLDQPNFTAQRDPTSHAVLTDPTGHPLYNMLTSTVMEYNATAQDYNWTPGWGYYDQGAIAWIYANNGVNTKSASKGGTPLAGSRSGQVDATYPYNDPMGFCASGSADCSFGISVPVKNGVAERRFLRCDDTQLKYSPMCRQFDLGVTPSEIVANEIDQYEWQYQYRNFRTYHKTWDLSNYAASVEGTIDDLRRFLSQWYFDWSPTELTDTLHRIGITPPPGSDGAGASSSIDYYNQLTQKFSTEMSKTNQMVAAFDEALIQQAAGERPYATVYDKFYGDETQQGIILDKLFAMTGFVGLWITDNYDQNQAGTYLSSWGDFDFDGSYQTVAETSVTSMIGTSYSAYPYFIPTAVALFAQDTHSPSFIGANDVSNPQDNGLGSRIEAKDWIGGEVFYREEDLINYFRTIAVASGGPASSPCATFESCTYDVTDPTQVSQDPVTAQFVGPDGLEYVYAYIPSRNEWVVARQDRNITTWRQIINYNTDLIGNKDDGSNGLYAYEYDVKYTIDSYEAYEQGSLTSDTQSSAGTPTDSSN